MKGLTEKDTEVLKYLQYADQAIGCARKRYRTTEDDDTMRGIAFSRIWEFINEKPELKELPTEDFERVVVRVGSYAILEFCHKGLSHGGIIGRRLKRATAPNAECDRTFLESLVPDREQEPIEEWTDAKWDSVLRCLPPFARNIVRDRFCVGGTHGEGAKRLGVTRSWYMQHLGEALEVLRIVHGDRLREERCEAPRLPKVLA